MPKAENVEIGECENDGEDPLFSRIKSKKLEKTRKIEYVGGEEGE